MMTCAGSKIKAFNSLPLFVRVENVVSRRRRTAATTRLREAETATGGCWPQEDESPASSLRRLTRDQWRGEGSGEHQLGHTTQNTICVCMCRVNVYTQQLICNYASIIHTQLFLALLSSTCVLCILSLRKVVRRVNNDMIEVITW